MSSAFTAKGEVKPVTDLVVGEVVVDTRMYPDGYYVVVRSRKVKKEMEGSKGGSAAWVEVNVKGKGKELDGEMYLRLGGVSSASGEASATTAKPATNPTPSAESSGDNGQQAGSDEERFLPLAYSIHTMPASPMHSSSLITEGGAVRHILRFSLPTAQYQVSSVKDPLTGELRTGPKKPLWLRVLEGLDEEEVKPQADEEGIDQDAPEGSDETAASKSARLQGAVVEIEVLPLSKASDDKDKEEKKKKRIKKVKVNDVEIPVVGEKESLTSLGREELLDDRIAKMSILLRTPNESEALPEELRLPIAIADDLVDPAVRGDSASTDASGLVGTSSVYLHPDGVGSKGPTGRGGGDAGGIGGEDKPGLPQASTASASTGSGGVVTSSGPGYSGGWGGLWSTYRFGFGRGAGAGGSLDKSGSEPPRKLEGEIGEGAKAGGDTTQLPTGEVAGGGAVSAESEAQETEPSPSSGAVQVQSVQKGLYPLSTVIIVALIAFLIGSLLRSLLSPADFIYVVSNVQEAEEANKVTAGGGWREIRRLLEIKYILGGWDFQVAAVRRHM
ncbi:hypothetical protein EST38_g1025 [Candolleomyces aberdarensis]|uniref:Uncharacterized protein n=1 Tax=Candolleomyces aberdarensis TaxID=2316362 RepID=A0A4Q2DZP7_9AGAR|nr:hypothetical protein EST38_g1025 [Candolleomyces aberdarensis]